MKYSLAAATATAALWMAALPARADQQGALDQMRSFAPYQQAVARAYQDYESGLSTHCGSIELAKATGHATVIVAPQVDAGGQIVNGIWTEQTQGVACGEKRRYTALVVFKDGAPVVYPLWRGDSYASPVLQHDAMLQVAGAMGLVGASCSPEVLDTELPNGPPNGKGIPWDEKWIVRSCNKRYLVPMHFVPDSTGTGINVRGDEVVTLPATVK
jgi:hypothetical protein